LDEVEGAGAAANKTVTSSFRIDGEVYRILQRDATAKNVSLNSLVNHVLRRYSEFGMYLSRFKTIVITLQAFNQMVDAVGDEALARIGSLAGGEIPKAVISTLYGQTNLQNSKKFLKLIAANTANWRYSEASSAGGTTVVLSHDLGHKGSVYFSNYFGSMFKIIGLSPGISQTDDSIILRF